MKDYLSRHIVDWITERIKETPLTRVAEVDPTLNKAFSDGRLVGAEEMAQKILSDAQPLLEELHDNIKPLVLLSSILRGAHDMNDLPPYYPVERRIDRTFKAQLNWEDKYGTRSGPGTTILNVPVLVSGIPGASNEILKEQIVDRLINLHGEPFEFRQGKWHSCRYTVFLVNKLDHVRGLVAYQLIQLVRANEASKDYLEIIKHWNMDTDNYYRTFGTVIRNGNKPPYPGRFISETIGMTNARQLLGGHNRNTQNNAGETTDTKTQISRGI